MILPESINRLLERKINAIIQAYTTGLREEIRELRSRVAALERQSADGARQSFPIDRGNRDKGKGKHRRRK